MCYRLSYSPVSVSFLYVFSCLATVLFPLPQHTLSHTLSGTVARMEGGQGSACLVLRLKGGLGDGHQRQEQMCLSQIKLVPFSLGAREERHSK